VLPVRCCGSYRLGHDVHFIQVRLSSEDGARVAHSVESVGDDGTIVFADGTSCWNHDPERLRSILAVRGPDVTLGKFGVLRAPSSDGWYCFSVADAPDPCRPETAEVRPGESLVDELMRRGGVLRSTRQTGAETDPSPRRSPDIGPSGLEPASPHCANRATRRGGRADRGEIETR
jgi:hypothetical protein